MLLQCELQVSAKVMQLCNQHEADAAYPSRGSFKQGYTAHLNAAETIRRQICWEDYMKKEGT